MISIPLRRLCAAFLLRFALAVLALCAAQTASAQSLDRAEALLRSGQTTEALAILERIAPTPDTVLRLSWARATGYMQRNEPRAALPFLERLVQAVPDEARFLIELGRALFLLEEDDRARFNFQLARAAPLSPRDRETVDSYIDAISKRRRVTTFLSFGIRPSDNPGKRTSVHTVNVAGLPLILNPDARKLSGTALAFGGGVVVRPRLSRNLRARISLIGEAELYDRGAENALTLAGEAGLEWLDDRGRVFGAGLSHLERIEDGSGSYRGTGVYLSFSGDVGQAGYVILRAEHGYRDYDGRGDVDGARSRVFARYSFGVTPNLALRTAVEYERVNATLDHRRSERAELTIGATYGFQGGLVLGLDLSRGRTRYDGVSPLFNARRSDDLTTLGARLYHRAFNVQGFAPVFALTYEHNDSALPFHSYDATRVSLGLTREF